MTTPVPGAAGYLAAAIRRTHFLDGSLNKASLDNLRAMAGGGNEVLAELADSVLVEGPELIGSLIGAAAMGDIPTIRQSAHSLQSNARDFGAEDLAANCGRIEESAGNGVLPEASDIAAARSAFNSAIGEPRFPRDGKS